MILKIFLPNLFHTRLVFLCFLSVNHLWDYYYANFESLKFILGLKAEASKGKEMDYSSANINPIEFVLFPSSLEPSINFVLIPKLAYWNVHWYCA